MHISLTVLVAIFGANTTARFFDVIKFTVFFDTRCNSSINFLNSNRFNGGSNSDKSCKAVSLFFVETFPSISTTNKFMATLKSWWKSSVSKETTVCEEVNEDNYM